MLSTEERVLSIPRKLQVRKRTAAWLKKILPLQSGSHFLKCVAANLLSKAELKLKFYKRENWNGRKKVLRSYDLQAGTFQTIQPVTQILALQVTSYVIQSKFPRSQASPALSGKVVIRRMTWKDMKIASPSAWHTVRTQFMLISSIIYNMVILCYIGYYIKYIPLEGDLWPTKPKINTNSCFPFIFSFGP